MRRGYIVVVLMASLPVTVLAAANSTRRTTKPQSTATPGQSAPATPPTLEQSATVPARVTFQSGQLSIVARNSTLGDILKQVQKLTGAEIEQPGSASERVVGTFGPGPARDVLSDLLYGSHYNYVVLGSETDPQAVAKVMLFPKGPSLDSAAPAQTAAAYQPNNAAPQNMPPRPFPGRPGMPVAAPQPAAGAEDTEGQADDDSTTDDQADDQTDNADDQSADNTTTVQGEEPADQNQQVRSPEQMLQELQQQQQQQQQQNPNQPIMRPGFPPGMQPGVPGGYPPGGQQQQQQ
jgi:hypothetical protein